MKKLLKSAVTLSLCTLFSNPFFCVSAQKPGNLPNTNLEEQTSELRSLMKNRKFVEDMNREGQRCSEQFFRSNPALKDIFDSKFLEFNRLIADFTNNDKRAVADYIVDISARALSMRVNGFENDRMESQLTAEVNSISIQNLLIADHLEKAVDLSHFLGQESAFDSYPDVGSYFLFKCLQVLL